MPENSAIKRVPPNSLEAERSVIGAMFMGKEPIIAASEILTADDFHTRQYGIMFEAITGLFGEGKPVDPVTIQERLKELQAPPEIRSSAFIADLVNAVPTSANIRTYAEIVHNCAVKRRIIRVNEEIADECYKGDKSVEELLSETETRIFNLVQSGGASSITPIRQIVLDVLEKIQEAALNGGQITGIETGFTDLDYKTAGFQRSDFILIAARPSMGKTAFALNIAAHAVFRNSMKVMIFSLEMSKEQLVNRLLAMTSSVNSQNIRTGQLGDHEWDLVMESAGMVGRSTLTIDDTPAISVSALRSKCLRLKLEKGLDMVVIDYLQLMSGGGTYYGASRQQEISDISRSLKALARELNVPVVALSQLSRAVEQRENHRPQLSDLRESGAIEQDADVVMFIYREDYYKPDTERKGIADIIIAKQRNGPIGKVELIWLADYTKFGNLERSDRK